MLDLEPHILALLGALTALLGAGIIAWGATALGSARSGGRSESLLAPTLAVDALDPDLRVMYMRTLVLDARCQARYGDGSWDTLGRELRRLLVLEQAERTADGSAVDLGRVEQLIELALDHVIAGGPLAEDWRRWAEEATAMRASHTEAPSEAHAKRSRSG